MAITLARGGARSDRHTTRHADQVEPPQAVMVGPTQAVRTKLARQIETTPASVLAKTASSEQTYLQDVAHRMTALRIAEEVVMQQLAWVSDPSLPLDEARQEWNQTTPNDENLIMWAERMQDAPDLMPSTVDLEQKAKDWAVPVWFLEGLVEAEIPRRYLEEHQSLLAEAATIRFLREVY